MPALHRAFGNPYDRAHRRARKTLVRSALGTRCPGAHVNGRPYRSPRCTGLMVDAARMHLDHTVPVALGGTRGDRIICAPCNLGAGAILGNQRRAPAPRSSRIW